MRSCDTGDSGCLRFEIFFVEYFLFSFQRPSRWRLKFSPQTLVSASLCLSFEKSSIRSSNRIERNILRLIVSQTSVGEGPTESFESNWADRSSKPADGSQGNEGKDGKV